MDNINTTRYIFNLRNMKAEILNTVDLDKKGDLDIALELADNIDTLIKALKEIEDNRE